MQGRTAFLLFFYRALMPDAGTGRANAIERLERAGKEHGGGDRHSMPGKWTKRSRMTSGKTRRRKRAGRVRIISGRNRQRIPA